MVAMTRAGRKIRLAIDVVSRVQQVPSWLHRII